MKNATFTYGDSQQNIMVWDFSWESLEAHAKATMIAAAFFDMKEATYVEDMLMAELCEKFEPPMVAFALAVAFLGESRHSRNPYFEIQIHRQLTTDDILRVI